MTRLILLTGPRDMGKTTACLRITRLANRAHLRLGGIISPGTRGDDGLKSAIDAVDLHTGTTKRLATATSETATVGRFRFDPHATTWALTTMLRALDSPLDAVIIDEIGPLELIQGRGYAAVLPRLPVARARAVVVLVRSASLGALRRRLTGTPCRIIRLSEANRDAVPRLILQAVLG